MSFLPTTASLKNFFWQATPAPLTALYTYCTAAKDADVTAEKTTLVSATAAAAVIAAAFFAKQKCPALVSKEAALLFTAYLPGAAVLKSGATLVYEHGKAAFAERAKEGYISLAKHAFFVFAGGLAISTKGTALLSEAYAGAKSWIPTGSQEQRQEGNVS